MTRWAILAAAVALAVSGCTRTEKVTPGDGLPFYDSADFTPRWVRTVDHRIGDFALVTQTGAPITREDLLGRVHVASFIFTTCAGICPAMVTQLSKVQKAIADRTDVWLVSYSAMPATDTPDVLAAFGAARHIDASRWKLVTGDVEQIYRLARTSYFADDGRLSAERPATDQFLHTEKAVLVDRHGRLRGVYNATLPHEIDKLMTDLGVLLQSEGP